ncbi:MAG: restriction endonuclease [Ignavibacteria bacterium]|nr:restriction endonuclease [Ignavibacteria bacterium]
MSRKKKPSLDIKLLTKVLGGPLPYILEAQRKIDSKNLRIQNAKLRIEEREQRLLARKEALTNKEERLLYVESRMQDIEELNQNLTNTISDLRGILQQALNTDSIVSFEKLRINEEFPKFALPTELEKEPVSTSREEYFSKISKPSVLGKLIPGWEKRYQRTLQESEKLYKEYEDKFNAHIVERNGKIAGLTEEYENDKSSFDLKIQQRNQEVDEFEKTYRSGDPAAISAYCSMILERSEYPDDFPQEFRVAYVPEPKELVVEYELPTKDIVPAVAEYKYIKTRDTIDGKLRKLPDIKELYQDIVAAVCLRTLHELFEADQENHLDVVVFNGYVQTTDPATGKDIRPFLISIRTIKEKFNEINLHKIDKRVCLRNLGAQVSPQPDELMAVKPVVNFNMVDKRYVNESDVISELDTKPNLMDLNPFEFENLVNNLFSKIGFEAKLTRSSRDGGIDVVAFDPRPILGGKVVIQVKRYKNVVGVSAVRDLYGSMINEGASKGLLVFVQK